MDIKLQKYFDQVVAKQRFGLDNADALVLGDFICNCLQVQ